MPDLHNENFKRKFRGRIMKLLYFCDHSPLWLDAYSVWRCEICFPPISDSEVRERKNASPGKSQPEKIQPKKIPSPEISNSGNYPYEILPGEFSVTPPDTYEFDPFDFLAGLPQEQESPCPDCGSLAFWWNLLDQKFCQRCHPRPKRSRELLELAPKLRAAAILAKQKSTAKK